MRLMVINETTTVVLKSVALASAMTYEDPFRVSVAGVDYETMTMHMLKVKIVFSEPILSTHRRR